MSLPGKILAVLNVLAAAGFLIVAGLDWQKKQLWADDVQQFEIRLDGLPVDASDKDREGHPRSENLRKSVLSQLFSNASGNPVRTQEEEVDGVHNRLQAQAEAAGANKPEELRKILYYLATTQEERDKLATMNADELQSQFNDKFEKVKQVPPVTVTDSHKKTQQGELPLEVKRKRIAALLFRLTPVLSQSGENAAQTDVLASPAYNRYLAVVGLAAAARAVDEQAHVVQRFSDHVNAGVALDRDVFLAGQRSLLQQIDDLRAKVDVQRQFLKEQSDLAAREKSLAAARQETLTKLEADLATARDETKKQLTVQAAMEKELFQSRRDFRNAFRKNEELEKQIREMEKGR